MRIINAGFPDIMICHGSPRKVNEKFAEEEQILKEVIEETNAEYVSLEADVERLLCEMREAGLYETAPFWTRFTELQVKSACGGYTHGDLLNKAMKICRDRYGECEWPKASEECFSEAFEILFPNV